MRFTGKVAVITGAGRGIGRAAALAFAREGAKVALCDVNQHACEEAVDAIRRCGGEAVGEQIDITDGSRVKGFMERAAGEFGTIDILVNNAGVLKDRLITDMTEEDWDSVVDVCLKGSFLCCKYAVPYMIKQSYGKIVNLSSRAYLGNPGQVNYSAAKAGVIGLTRALSKELGKHYITVNAVAPSLVATELVLSHPKFALLRDLQLKQTPIPRLGETEDVINAILFLASDESAFISGDVLHVSGGRKG
ncbi:SDR family NAD(P)-dependent oxidoreductase [Anaeroselena agilis]|uniref:SDR family NAD(P)-dependent oxidoreductase n=1 Tax=Anaeroselena agilis TaxID=3063788 RepID=A0ABU3P4N9_9FIRM|nr:SDR family NAD(P)-dependent oxidoreductase [Selenomonadales bacterium 4137-cl]